MCVLTLLLLVTGVPHPSPTHAADMACLALELVPRLASALVRRGIAPGLLRCRIGIHSGAVTAGVLRTDRARFQLFGDAVNTASRSAFSFVSHPLNDRWLTLLNCSRIHGRAGPGALLRSNGGAAGAARRVRAGAAGRRRRREGQGTFGHVLACETSMKRQPHLYS